MADITKNIAVRDGAVEVTATAGAASQTFKYDTVDEKTALLIANSHATTAATVTVKAGDGIRSSIGDLTVSVPAGKTYLVGPLDSMRFKSLATGMVTVTISGGTNTITHISL